MATPQPDQLVTAYAGSVAEIRKRVLAYVAAVWSNSPAFRDADIDRIVARIVPVVQAGQLQVATLTNAYIGRMAVLSGVTWNPDVLERAAIIGYRGVPADVVYRRPAVTTYTALSNGTPFADAVQQGLNRLLSISATDIQQSRNRTASTTLGRSGFKFFRRSLSGSENCALCAIASTQRYTRGNLMPIHPGCDCGVEPIAGDKDPGQIIDPETLELIHAEVERHTGSVDRGARAPDYRDLLVTNLHGELGPTLGWRGDHFTGPSDIPAVLAD